MEKNRPFGNLFYFRKISRIGGTEQFLYEIAKKYGKKHDITVLYDTADFEQLFRLQKHVRCIRRNKNIKYYAKKAFYNFNIEAIEQVEADTHNFIVHAVYQELEYYPPIDHPKIDNLIAVSRYAKDKIETQKRLQNVDKPVILCYNPLTIEKVDPVVRIISAGRLDDKVKGGERTNKLIDALDRYAEKHNRQYLWTIFTNHTNKISKSPNVAIMPARIDIRPYIADADFLVQVSNDMETYCYSINEALEYGTKIVRTPLSVAKELNIPKSAEIVLDWDGKNVDKVAKAIFEAKKERVKYSAPKDGWLEMLDKKKRDYKRPKTVLIKPTKPFYDIQKGENVDTMTKAYEVKPERAKELYEKGLIRIV